MGSFFHAVHVFWDHLAAVRWQFLALALALNFGRLIFRAIAWRVILMAAYPGERIRPSGACSAHTWWVSTSTP